MEREQPTFGVAMVIAAAFLAFMAWWLASFEAWISSL